MNDTAFNTEEFLNETVESPFETHRTTVPAKDDYLGVVWKIAGRKIEPKDGKPGRAIMDIQWEILDDQLKVTLNLERVVVRQSVFLDYNEHGRLAWGPNQNIQLGQVRNAVGQNQPGVWQAKQLIGAGPARLKVTERLDEDNPEIKYNDVVRVSPVVA